MRLSLIQMNSQDDPKTNVDKACAYLDKAAKDKPDLIVLPEFFNTFYFAQYRDYAFVKLAERDDGPTMTRIKEKARRHKVHILATIYEEEAPGLYYDTAMLVTPDGEIAGKYRKTHPAGMRAVEKLYFRYGSRYPVFNVGDWKVGVVICYDLSLPESARCVALNGAELILVPFCAPVGYHSPDATTLPTEVGEAYMDKETFLRRWNAQMLVRAWENIVYLAALNHCGQERDAVFAGGSVIVDPSGKFLAQAGEKEEVITAELDKEELRRVRMVTTYYRDRRPDLYLPITAEMEDLPLF